MSISASNTDHIYRHMVQEVLDYAIFLLDLNGNIQSWNHGGERVKGYKPEEVIGRHVSIFYTPEDRASGKVEAEMRVATETGRSEDESWRVHKDGSRFWANEIMTALRDERGEVYGFVKIARDLTERRRIEDQLRQSEQRFRAVVEGVADYAILLTDVNRQVQSWNPAATLITGYTEDEIVGRPADILFTPEDVARGMPAKEAATAAQNGRAEDERWHLRKNGSRFWGSGIMTARRDQAGNLVGFIKILRDQTARKHAEEELRTLNDTLEQRVSERTGALLQNQRQLRQLASELGKTEQRERQRLAVELHDHLTQMLAICSMKLSVVRASFGVGRVPKAADELSELLTESLNYTRTLMADLSPLPLNENDIVEAVKWVANRMKQHGLEVAVADDGQPKHLSEDLHTVLFQSVRELLYNIVKHAGAHTAKVMLRRVDNTVEIEIADPGKGFNVSERAFRPSGEGGFGLFNIRERLELLGGQFRIESAPGRGTRATLVAPHIQTEAPAEVSPAAAEEAPSLVDPSHKIRIMVVDDHRMMRKGLRGLLESEPDFVVVAEAGDGIEAIEVARQEQPDVITMDINMPNMNGVEATRRIKAELPAAQIIGLSVHEEEAMEQAMRRAGASAYHKKGGVPQDLYQEIRSLVRR
jgi:PAS domain S-box-containing protein